MRKTKTVTIDADGRDKGKSFLIEEMSADAIERWAYRAFLALARSGVELPLHIANAGAAGLLALSPMGLRNLAWSEAEPLIDQLMSCVKRKIDLNGKIVIREMVADDTEEFATRMKLRMDAFDLHVGFYEAVAKLRESVAAAEQLNSQNTPISPTE